MQDAPREAAVTGHHRGTADAVGPLIFSIPAVLIKDVYREWAASHKALYQYIRPVDIVSFRLKGLVNLIDARFFGSPDPGLSQVHIFVSEQRLRALQNDLPRSVKKWQWGQMLYPDGSLQNIQVRHQGDNPFNWLLSEKIMAPQNTQRTHAGKCAGVQFDCTTGPRIY